MISWNSIVLHQSSGVTDPMSTAVLDRLPDGGEAKRLSRMNGDVEITPAKEMKRFIMICGRVPRLVASQIKSDHSTISELNRHLRRTQRNLRVHMPQGADDDPDIDAGALTPDSDPVQYRLENRCRIEPLLDMKNRCEPNLSVDHTICCEAFDMLSGDSVERLFILHH